MRVTLFILLMCASLPAVAGELRHTLREGETLQNVARYFYGSSWKAAYIAGANGLSAETDAKPGRSYIIPAAWVYKIRKGDSLATIAKKQLGNSERFRAIMAANGIAEYNDLEVGRELTMPFVIKHTVGANESLSSITKTYFHNTKQMKAVQEYNLLATNNVALGTTILVPVFDKDTIDVKKKAPMPKGSGATAAVEEAPPEAADKPKGMDPPLAAVSDDPTDRSPGARIRRAVKEYQTGDFDPACRDLERLLGEPRLTRDDRLRVIEYCGYCAIAFNEPGPARDYFRRWLEMKPDVQLDPVLTSPKIRAAVEDARKELQRTAQASAQATPPTDPPPH